MLDPRTGRRFEAIIFDWDGTAVFDRRSPADHLRPLIEKLCAAGMEVAIVSGTNLTNIDHQLEARPAGPGKLFLLLNRGSEIFSVDTNGVHLLDQRRASELENAALDAAAAAVREDLSRQGLETAVIRDRLNRRKIDLIPFPQWMDPPKAQIQDLVGAVQDRLRRHQVGSLEDVVALATARAREAGLADPRVTSDAKHVEIGLTDKSDSARWFLAQLWKRGVGPGLVLIAGDEMGPLGGVPGSDSYLLIPEAARATAVSVGLEPGGVPEGVVWSPGGPEVFLELLQDQLRRRQQREVPGLDPDPRWLITVEGLDPQREPAQEAELTLADGRIGASGSPFAHHEASRPRVLVSGVYIGRGADQELLHAPIWQQIARELSPGLLRRRLDLRTGLLHQDLGEDGSDWSALSFVSLDRPGTAALRVEGPSGEVPSHMPLGEPGQGNVTRAGEAEHGVWMQAGDGGARTATTVTRDAWSDVDSRSRWERIAVVNRSAAAARRHLSALPAGAAYDWLLARHRASWARRWEEAGVELEGDLELERAIRFAIFHLIGSAGDRGETAVGARGLTGLAYRGHVFWDSEIFVLPFLAATHPRAARAMLNYRSKRLPAALAAAHAAEREGARFPWESAAAGTETAPTHIYDQHNHHAIPIKTGLLEEHIVADVAWAVRCYLDWTGDQEFAAGPGAELLTQTARYWASRIRVGPDGKGHIYGVIGPDEYHDGVDDNAYTNVMARWNLRQAAEIEARGAQRVGPEEAARWRALGESLVDGYDARSGVYEQFAGYFGLEAMQVSDFSSHRPVAADALLGADRVNRSQVIKQADVLMLHHLVPGDVAAGSLLPNLDFYEPRTAHGSSLSPGIHAALLARAGRLEAALEALRLTSRLDLDDITGSTAGGIHLAAMGSLWQAIVLGFAGVRAAPEGLFLDPHLPASWPRLVVRLRFRGTPLTLSLEPGQIAVEAKRSIKVQLPGQGIVETRPGRTLLQH